MKKILIASLLIICFLFIGQKAEAKIWTKDLVDKVTLDSGYKFSLCTIDLQYDRTGQADNIFSAQEKEFEANPNAYPCNKQSQEDILFANITLNFSKANWDGGSAPEKLIEFQNHLYSVDAYSDVSTDPNGKAAISDISPVDWFSTLPGINGIRGDRLINTDPNAPKGQQALANSHFLIIHDSSGKFTSALFVFNNIVYKISNTISQVTVPATLVDYTQQEGATTPSLIPPSEAPAFLIPTAVPTSAPTAVPLSIQIHLLDTATGNPVPNNGLKATISGQGINKTIENQAEASFELSSPGTYVVTSTNPSDYSANEISCSDNSKCRATTSEFCGMEVSLTQGKIDVYCKYNKSSGSSNNPPPSNTAVNLSSIDPGSGTVGSSIALRGSGFGSSTGYVIFYNSYGQPSGGAPTDSWSDTEIKARVPGIAPRDTYQVDVENSNGSRSNRVSFTVVAN